MNFTQSVREAHEAYIKGHSGSSPHDTIFAVYPTISSSIAAAIAGQRFPGWFGLLLEYILLVVPLTLSFTHLADYALELSMFMLAITAVSLFFIQPSACKTDERKSGRLQYLTPLRGHLNVVTVICILAVDFRSFPRRFVKTEEYGYSLMDLGAAGFVINNGIVEGRKRPLLRSVVRDGLILAILGVLRLILVRAADYQHHVTEYGVHANFFFTLAFVKITCSWWIWKLSCLQSLLFSILIGIAHLAYLTYGGGTAWGLSDAPRDTLVSANREWIIALAGYMSIYLIGAAIGDYIFNKSSYRIGKNLAPSLFLLTLVALGIMVALHHFVDKPSRRVANPTFVYFVVFYLLVILTHYTMMEEIISAKFPGFTFSPTTYQAINRNPLVFFLLANAGTGLVNKSINTLDIGYPNDLVIINSYTLALVIVVLFLNANNSKLPGMSPVALLGFPDTNPPLDQIS